jgi:hypothetical protein
MVNGIARASMQMKSAQLSQSVSTSVMKMGMNQTKAQASDLMKMIDQNRKVMERAVNPHLGGTIDISV